MMAGFQSRNAVIGGGAVAVAIAVGAAYLLTSRVPPDMAPPSDIAQTAPDAPRTAAVPAPDSLAPETPIAAPDTGDTPAALPDQTVAAPDAPSFDEVRRDSDGVTVIAGRAAPGSDVRVLSNGQEIAKARADSAGKFAALAMLPPDGKGTALQLEATGSNGPVASAADVILAPMTAPPVAPPEPVATAEPTAPPTTAPKTDPTAPEPNPQIAELPAQDAPNAPNAAEIATDTAAPQPVTAVDPPQPGVPPQPAPQIAALKSTPEGVELLSPAPLTPADRVELDTITYSETGEVRLAGRARTGSKTVRVYLDNGAVSTLDVDEQGRWRGDIEGIQAGIYTLRVDELNQGGEVISRIETPFKRETPEALARATATLDGPISAVTVQEGATLWAIARDRYGDPLLYVRVFEANRDSIRDPDLIYPGQVFDLPD